MGQVVKNYSDKIMQATKMPFYPLASKAANQVFIGETEFVIPEKETEVIKLYIYLASPKFSEEALSADFGKFSDDKVNCVRDLKDFVLSFDREHLRKVVGEKNGDLAVVLNGHKVTLRHKHHFWFDLRDLHSN